MADTEHTDERPEGDGGSGGEAGPEPAPEPGQDPGGPGSARERRAGRRAERTVARLVREVTAFAAAHGGAEAQTANLGRAGVRIVLVGEDGRWGDLVAPADALARQALERAGITTHEDFDAELAAKVRTGPYEWKRMAGIQLGGRA